MALETRLLDPSIHIRSNFTCGVLPLDDYLKNFAVQQSKKGVATVYVMVEESDPTRILGYYCLSAAQVSTEELNQQQQKKLPRYPVPCFRMGRLALHSDCHGQGLGGVLLGYAIERCQLARQHVAAYALLVDAKDDKAKQFYEYYGFQACQHQPLTLYLPL